MILRQIGSSGIQGSAVVLGTHAIGGGQAWGDSNENEAVRTIQAAAEAGMNTIDLAPMYGYGLSERLTGKAMAGQRDKYVIITKCGLWLKPEGSFHGETDGRRIYRNLSPSAIQEQLEESLRNLGTDYVDIYMAHWPAAEPFKVPVSETMETLLKLKEEGKIRAIGLSNVSREDVEEYLQYGPIDVIQNRYSLLYRNAEQDMFPLCEKHNISFMAYSSMEMGLLTGKIGMDYQVPPGYFRNRIRWFETTRRRMLLDTLHKWDPLCGKYHCTTGNLCTALTLSQRPYLFSLFGARRVDQVMENARGADIRLEPADAEKMNRDLEELFAEEGKLTPDPKYRF